MTKTTKLFRTGGSLAVRIPKSWAPDSERVQLRREGASIIITPEKSDLIALAKKFSADGIIEYERMPQPETPDAKEI